MFAISDVYAKARANVIALEVLTNMAAPRDEHLRVLDNATVCAYALSLEYARAQASAPAPLPPSPPYSLLQSFNSPRFNRFAPTRFTPPRYEPLTQPMLSSSKPAQSVC